MASPLTRSSRRSEVPKSRSGLAIRQNKGHDRTANLSGIARKRLREASDDDQDRLKIKKTRIAVEIDARPKAQPKKRPIVTTTVDATPKALTHRSTRTHSAALSTSEKVAPPTTHAEKVVNGIKHELGKLRPSEADIKDEKRKLRSQEGTRFKSELSAYFPDYDIIIGNEPEESHFFNIDTPIIVIDSNPPEQTSQHTPSPKKSPKISRTSKIDKSKSELVKINARHFPDSLFHNLYQAQRVDFTFLNRHTNGSIRVDPLADAHYDPAHRRAERLERSIRNSEKGRAQHEKDQVTRLLEGLRGHEWLKVMGVSGITESKKRDYEPARQYFVKGCQQILEKFKIWREEEKRRKLEKDRALAEAAVENETQEKEDEDEIFEEGKAEDEVDDGAESDGDPPDYSDVDHAAARQLHEEAIARSGPSSHARASGKKDKLEPVEEPPKEFRSFYAKAHLRQAAVGKIRRSGRSILAWGQPLPEINEEEFDLPAEYRDKETIEANARRRRRSKRESKS